MSQQRHPTKAWVVLADDDGPIVGFELPNLREWRAGVIEEPILADIASRFSFVHTAPVTFDLKLTNEGPFTQYTPRPDAEDQWTPADRLALNPPEKDEEGSCQDQPT